MSNLVALKTSILADGKIDLAEVEQIRTAIYEDGRIDSEEANFLFDLNDCCSGAENDASWQALFVDAICSHLLDDISSPGEIDSDEAEWLLGRIQGDGQIDAVERALLEKLAGSVTMLPVSLSALLAR